MWDPRLQMTVIESQITHKGIVELPSSFIHTKNQLSSENEIQQAFVYTLAVLVHHLQPSTKMRIIHYTHPFKVPLY